MPTMPNTPARLVGAGIGNRNPANKPPTIAPTNSDKKLIIMRFGNCDRHSIPHCDLALTCPIQ